MEENPQAKVLRILANYTLAAQIPDGRAGAWETGRKRFYCRNPNPSRMPLLVKRQHEPREQDRVAAA